MGKLGIVVILFILEQLSANAGGKTILAVPVVVCTMTQFVSHSNFYQCFSHVSQQKRGPEGGGFQGAC